MMLEKLKAKLPEYMKSKDTLRLGVLRYFLAQVKNKEIELRVSGEEVTDEHIVKIIKKEIKMRNETIELAEKSGRDDVVERETAEKNILEEFMTLAPEYVKE